MDLLITAFNELLYRPLFNALVWLYNILPGHDLGVAIIVLTVIIRLLLYPLTQQAIESQKALTELQPKIKELQKRYKTREEQARAMMELYRQHKINPLSGFLPLLIQLPILIALYQVFLGGLDPERLNGLYSFVSQPAALDPMFLGIINLSQRHMGLAVLAGFLMFIQSKMTLGQKKSQPAGLKIGGKDFSSMMGQQMTYFMPLITILIAWSLPAALPLYWIVITLFGIGQQYLVKSRAN